MILSPKHPIYTANDLYREKLGGKVLKLAIDGGFTCPNRDGTLSDKGCIFCSAHGSGDFAARSSDISDQVVRAKQLISQKWPHGIYMIYFQAFTNTYAPAEKLRKIYTQALEAADAKALSVATRPDCINDDVIDLLKELAQKYYVTVELGLQTSDPNTALFINRCYENDVYLKAVKALNAADLDVITHIILGLPGEDTNTMQSSVDFAVNAGTSGIKLQLLHILEGTRLAQIYRERPFRVFEKQEYIELVVDMIEKLPPDIAVHRMTGDAPKALMIRPRWSLDKRSVLNGISKEFIKRGTYQGKFYSPDGLLN